jgi:uncharacterized surface protein with fasciclin (FAS1) repeats
MDRRALIRMTTLGSVALLAACGGAGVGSTSRVAPSRAGSSRGVLDVARANDLNSFLRAVETAGLTEQLSGAGPYTLFAPTDAAFRAARVSPTGDRETLRRVLGYHVVPGHVSSSFMTGLDMNHLTATGEALNVNGQGGRIRVNDASLVRADLEAGNGVVHVLDRVLTPA